MNVVKLFAMLPCSLNMHRYNMFMNGDNLFAMLPGELVIPEQYGLIKQKSLVPIVKIE